VVFLIDLNSWNLPGLLSAIQQTGGSRSRAAAFFAGAALVISQSGVNVPGNALSGGFDFAALFPKYLNIRRGAYLTALLSMVVNPWQLLATASTFLSVLSSYSVFLGPMIGLMISSYYVINKQKINVDDLYVGSSESVYWFSAGINWRAAIAWICGVAPSMPGFISAVSPGVKVPIGATRLYYICFLNGLAISAVVFIALNYIFPARQLKAFVDGPATAKETIKEYRARWDALAVDAIAEQEHVKEVERMSELPKSD
jgi:nucleobase:cation symporter-1, NCS1 family